MKTLQVGEFKRRFSEVLDSVRGGDEIAVTYGKKKEKVAILIPFDKYRKKNKRKIGVAAGRGSCIFHEDFEISDDEFLQS
ncbi:MAG TPA: type II toxin-antitoxin system Phd/YefM family antitoxin [Spirochaetota bacterium]|nr:type II toxin-antitoxin system Phd/YefM family antitoxin [Spirochaetota bacterium]